MVSDRERERQEEPVNVEMNKVMSVSGRISNCNMG